MAITKEEAQQICNEVKEGAMHVHKFLSLPKEDKVMVLREALDKEIGSDPGAMYPTIPGLPLPSGFVESMTDPLLDKIAEMVIKILSGE